MDQELNTPKPTLQQQIEFVRGARHMVYNEKRVVEIDHRHHLMLQEIEENLISVQLFNQAQSVTVPATRAEPQFTAAATSFGKTNMYVCDMESSDCYHRQSGRHNAFHYCLPDLQNLL
jgi:hypothetical protein